MVRPARHASHSRQHAVCQSNSVVESTIPIDLTTVLPHRKGIAAAFGKCAGLASSSVTQKKGGK
jgi:hypothetical protein